jgi:NAD/NADP transhydrogenase beta subunit
MVSIPEPVIERLEHLLDVLCKHLPHLPLHAKGLVPRNHVIKRGVEGGKFGLDVVLVLGANDVVNPAAKTDPASPIYGMPILEVELAKNCIVNKRSMKPGYAGIENDLFFRPKTSMLFGDAKKVLQDLVAEIKNL